MSRNNENGEFGIPARLNMGSNDNRSFDNLDIDGDLPAPIKDESDNDILKRMLADQKKIDKSSPKKLRIDVIKKLDCAVKKSKPTESINELLATTLVNAMKSSNEKLRMQAADRVIKIMGLEQKSGGVNVFNQNNNNNGKSAKNPLDDMGDSELDRVLDVVATPVNGSEN